MPPQLPPTRLLLLLPPVVSYSPPPPLTVSMETEFAALREVKRENPECAAHEPANFLAQKKKSAAYGPR